jgi:squalene monooxygenase
MSNNELKIAVFEYLAKGGDSSNGPISLLSGLNRNPAVLIKHFIYVALLCIRNLLSSKGKGIGKAFGVVKDTFCIIWPLAYNEIRLSSFFKKNTQH